MLGQVALNFVPATARTCRRDRPRRRRVRGGIGGCRRGCATGRRRGRRVAGPRTSRQRPKQPLRLLLEVGLQYSTESVSVKVIRTRNVRTGPRTAGGGPQGPGGPRCTDLLGSTGHRRSEADLLLALLIEPTTGIGDDRPRYRAV